MVGVDKISKNEFLIDSHKLIYHPNEVSKWMNKEIIAPIYVEIGPINTCNHDCIFCGLDFVERDNLKLDKDLLIENLKDILEEE